MKDFHLTTSQPLCWWSHFEDTLFCPKCNCGQYGMITSCMRTCPECGYFGNDYVHKIARKISTSVWYKPQTWGTFKLEVK